ncbi:mtDNA inheritance, partitioning of the mitochondrial organelle [Coemansia sp. BCRC 34490]|nr:mtDNA inheritance, partitioning of the mitochondrial organelle [Coemansia sp. BCRC 34490]
MREIITLQFGEHANYVGMHFWNMAQQQAEKARETSASGSGGDADSEHVLFSERRRQPRALVFDRASAFGSLGRADMQSTGDDARDQEQALWGGASEVYRQQQPEHSNGNGNTVDQSGGGVQAWPDFRQSVEFGSRSLEVVSGIEFGNSLGEMTTFDEGWQVFSGTDARRGDVLDDGGFRMYAEECDRVQGFQTLADATGGFAGYAAAFVERVRDEFPKSPVVVYSVDAAATRGSVASAGPRAVDVAVATATALESASLGVSLYLPSHVGDGVRRAGLDSLFGASGLLAMNVAQWTQPLVEGSRVLDDVVALVTQQSHLRLAESMVSPGLRDIASNSNNNNNNDKNVADIVSRRFTACSDVADDCLRSLGGAFSVDRGTSFGGDVLARYLPSPARVRCADGAVVLPTVFPNILRSIGRDGFIAQHPPSSATTDADTTTVGEVRVAGLLCTTRATAVHLQQLRSVLSVEGSRYLKDYERDTIRELRYALDGEIDKYMAIG